MKRTLVIALLFVIPLVYVGFVDCRTIKKQRRVIPNRKKTSVKSVSKVSPDSLYNSANLKIEMGDTVAGIENLASIMAKFPSDSFADMARLRLIYILIHRGEYTRALLFLSGRWNDEDKYGTLRELLMNRCYNAIGVSGMEYLGWMRLATFFTGDSLTFREAEKKAAKIRVGIKGKDLLALPSELGGKDTSRAVGDTVSQRNAPAQTSHGNQ